MDDESDLSECTHRAPGFNGVNNRNTQIFQCYYGAYDSLRSEKKVVVWGHVSKRNHGSSVLLLEEMYK